MRGAHIGIQEVLVLVAAAEDEDRRRDGLAPARQRQPLPQERSERRDAGARADADKRHLRRRQLQRPPLDPHRRHVPAPRSDPAACWVCCVLGVLRAVLAVSRDVCGRWEVEVEAHPGRRDASQEEQRPLMRRRKGVRKSTSATVMCAWPGWAVGEELSENCLGRSSGAVSSSAARGGITLGKS